MVIQVVGALAAVAKVNYSRTLVDSITARLHYQWSTTFCLMSGALVIAKDFLGDAIECMQDGKNVPKYLNTYCWITSTFTINSTDGGKLMLTFFGGKLMDIISGLLLLTLLH